MLKPLLPRFRSNLPPRLKDIVEKYVSEKLKPIVVTRNALTSGKMKSFIRVSAVSFNKIVRDISPLRFGTRHRSDLYWARFCSHSSFIPQHVFVLHPQFAPLPSCRISHPETPI